MYCTRTVPEMEKVLAELRVLQKYREEQITKDGGDAAGAQILGLGLSR